MNFRNLFLLFFLGMLACDKNEAVNPEVVTDFPQQLATTSVVIGGNIKEAGSTRPIQYGFLWDTSAGLNISTSANHLDLGTTDVKRVYTVKLENLTPGTEYFVKAYAASPDYSKIFYGNEISFRTLE